MSACCQIQWLKVSFPCPEIVVEAASDLLGVLSGSAVEQSPMKNGLSTISGFFQLSSSEEPEEILKRLEPALAELFAAYNLPLPLLEQELLADEDWATSWQQFFTPFAIVPGLIIKPSWEQYTAQPGEQVLEIDPGMAFGTGQHASTKLALSLMQNCFQVRTLEKVLDVGTGTGILAMAAVLFGARRVVAIDNDPGAVQVAEENIAINSLGERIAVATTPLAEIDERFDLICANILHDVLVDMALDIRQRLKKNGNVVLAGLLRGEQEANIIQIYSKLGLEIQQKVYEEEWVALLFSR